MDPPPRVTCPICGQSTRASAPTCELCGYVLDDQRRAAMEEAARRRAAARASAAKAADTAAPLSPPSAVPVSTAPTPHPFLPQLQLSVGTLLSQTFSIFFSNLLSFLLLTTIVLSPALILQAMNLADPSSVRPGPSAVRPAVRGLLPSLLFLLLSPTATAALIYSVFQQLRGKPTSIGNSVSVGLSRLLPVIGVGICVGLATLVGYIFCCVPGIIFSAMLYVSTPVAVVERRGIFDSMRRSAELTRDNRWTIFGLIFSLGLLMFVGGLLSLGLLIVSYRELGLIALGVAVSLLVSVAGYGLQATAAALTYYRLRTSKESIDADELAAVFD